MNEFLVNGIDEYGKPLFQGLTLADIARVAQGMRVTNNVDLRRKLQAKRDAGRAAQDGDHDTRGTIQGVDNDNLAQAGWGVVFASGADPEVIRALEPLLKLRREQAGDLYQELTGVRGYHPGESKQSFLSDRGADKTGPADPKKMPYYLMLVGDPVAIPFEFQYELDVQYAVGRLCFDTAKDYADYADAVVRAEAGKVTVEPRAAFLGVQSPDDRATELSTARLVRPLATAFEQDLPAWTVERLIEDNAYQKDLLGLLRRPRPPALLFTASHGVGYSAGHDDQISRQGALILQDWPGEGPSKPEHIFSAAHLDGLNTAGMITFHFACYSGGTPRANQFFGYGDTPAFRNELRAPAPFVSALPKRLLTKGTLASVGHVDIACATTFMDGASTASFQSMLTALANGKRIGDAMDYFNVRHAELSVGLAMIVDDMNRMKTPPPDDFPYLWLQNNDARNYVVAGDPAVKLPLAADRTVKDRTVTATRLTQRITDLEAELAGLRAQLQKL